MQNKNEKTTIGTVGTVERTLKPFDQEAANRIINYLGGRPWSEVDTVIEDFRQMVEDYALNYEFTLKVLSSAKVISAPPVHAKEAE